MENKKLEVKDQLKDLELETAVQEQEINAL